MLLSTASPSHAKPNVRSIALLGGEPLTQCSCQYPLSHYKWAALRTALSPQLQLSARAGLHRLLPCSCLSLLLLKVPLLLLFLLYFCANMQSFKTTTSATARENYSFKTSGNIQFGWRVHIVQIISQAAADPVCRG